MTRVDEAFLECGKVPGLEIWRIEKLHPVRQDKSTYGNFYTGDSYIVLATRRKGVSALEWDIHFWLGAETTQDEAGVAAYKTVELDDHLGGFPVQYREVQKHESKKFLDLFPEGVRYLDGGIESGFKKVDRDAYVKKLFIVKGKRNIRIEQVEISYESLNQGDVFILDDGKTIYCWNGKDSTKRERVQAASIARKIKDNERGGKAKVVLIDSGVDPDSAFFKALGGKGPIKSAEEGGDDDEYEKLAKTEIALYRVSDATGELIIEKTAEPPFKKEDLDSDDCFILDAGKSGVFSWIGTRCTKQEKKAAMDTAMKFIHEKGYPSYTQVSRVVEGGEPPLFLTFFASWKTNDEQVGLGEVKNSNIAKYSNESFDLSKLHDKNANNKKEKLPDDGKSGSVKIWRIENFKHVDVPREDYGQFYEGDCYIVFYTYKEYNRNYEKYLLYFWLGLKSTADEQGAAAMIAKKMDDDYNGAPVMVRVVQNKEPEHFLRMFQGRMVILKGGVDSGFSNRKTNSGKSSEPENKVQLYQVRGTNEYNTRAVEVIARAASLNSNDVFIVKAKNISFKWEGAGSSEDEKEFAESITSFITSGSDLETLEEGSEPEEFWDLLGGKEAYASMARLSEAEAAHGPRLFQCSNASGRFWVEEIHNFDQDDLCEDDVMLLDTYDEIFVWVGEGANFTEKKQGLHGAREYLSGDTTGRTEANTPILQVKQGYEPLNFTGYFLAWDPEKWSRGMTYEDLKKQLGEENVGISTLDEELEKYTRSYPYERLINRNITLDGVDPCNKEDHLSEADFELYFKMKREDYKKLRKWKQDSLKKALKLF